MRVKDAVAACLTEASGQYLSGETLAGREPKRCLESRPPVAGRGFSH
jgi:pyruvate kinase